MPWKINDQGKIITENLKYIKLAEFFKYIFKPRKYRSTGKIKQLYSSHLNYSSEKGTEERTEIR